MEKSYPIKISEGLLNHSLSGIVHSVFKRTVNVITKEGFFYTICTPEIFEGPNQIKVSATTFIRLNCQVNDVIKEDKDSLILKHGKICDLINASIQPKIQAVFPNAVSDIPIKQLIDLNQWLVATQDTVGLYRKTFENDVEKMMHTMLLSGCQTLFQGLVTEDEEKIHQGIKSLVGLGHGLTPSGDDILTGYALVLNSKGFPRKKVQMFFDDSLRELLKETNLISQNQLILSLEGQSLGPVIHFINHLTEDIDFETLKAKCEPFYQIGSSSGKDMLSGIIQAFLIFEGKNTN